MLLSDPLNEVIRPGLALLPEKMGGRDAEILLLAIGLQESGFMARKQHNDGPARGFWQFEKGGGVRGVLRHHSSRALAEGVCKARGVVPEVWGTWYTLAQDDVLAAAFARLLLWTAAGRLPREGEVGYGWEYYLDTWRPGKPHENRWAANYATAVQLAGAQAA